MTVTLTIDGRQATVPKGTLIVEAAKQVGIEIPVFCYHPKLEPVGMCRMCLVTVGTPLVNRATGQSQLDADGLPIIRWFPKPQTACTMSVSEGMVVITDSQEVAVDRKAILEFLLTSHPLDCPVCDKGGECPLQDLTYRHGPGVSRFDYDSKHHSAKRYPLGDLIVLDRERCILCARCTRFQSEIAQDPVLAIENRGRDARIVSYSNPVFDSHYSGNTTDICPVGALTSRDFRFHARAWELTNIPSLCNHCGVGCNTVLSTRRGQIARIMPRQNETVNEVWICDKGRFGHHFNSSPYRLTMPLIRRDGELAEASWDDALQHVASRLTSIIEAHGSDSIGGIAGACLPNEDLYLFQKFLREVIGTHNVDHRVGLSATFEDDTVYAVGVGTGTDLGRVGRDTAFLVIGSDLDQEAPILYLRVAGAARHGATLITAGGRPTKLDKQSNHSLRYRYGTATHLLLGMIHVILEANLTGNETVPHRVNGLNELRANVADWAPERVAEITGVPPDEIRAAARAFGEAKNGIVLYGPEGLGWGNGTQGTSWEAGSPLRQAVANLVTLTGFIGRPNNGVIAVLPHANSRGAVDLGVVPDRLPGYVPAERPGLNAQEMLGGGVRALLVAGADPLAGVTRADELEFLVVQELFLTQTAQQADVILPAAALAERDGTFTNLERWVQRFDPGLPVPGQARPDWTIIRQLAVLLGADWAYATVGGVLAEMAQAIPLYRGMSYEQLSQPVSLSRRMSHYIYAGMSFQAEMREGMQWPALAEDESAKLELDWLDPPAPPAEGDGFTLVAPRVLYDGGTLLGQAEILGTRLVQPHIALSSADAAALGVLDGQGLQVVANGQSVSLPARVDDLVPQGVVAIPRNLKGAPAESLLGEGRIFSRVKVVKG